MVVLLGVLVKSNFEDEIKFKWGRVVTLGFGFASMFGTVAQSLVVMRLRALGREGFRPF